MKIVQKMLLKNNDHMRHEGVTIAFLGDSVTQGCFEIYKKEDNQIETVFDKQHSYEKYVFDILCLLYPIVTVNIINAGVSGDRATWGLERIERDVLRHEPDLTIVCYGLNDCTKSENSIETYTNALKGIFRKIKACGSEIIFMTPNMMNTKISPHLIDPDYVSLAKMCSIMQNDGTFDAHIDAAKKLCNKENIKVCDCYAIWKTLEKNGVNTTELLANKINHPTREMNKLFAYELVRTMLE